MKCVVCGTVGNFKNLFSLRDRVFSVDGSFDFLRCPSCAAVIINPQLSGDALMAHYPSTYHEDYTQRYESLSAKKGVVNKVRAFLKFGALAQFFGYGRRRWFLFFLWPLVYEFAQYPRFVRGGKLFEAGSGTGAFLKLMDELGWDVYGCDISPSACAVAASMGLTNISCGPFDPTAHPQRFFDAVVLYHVLEHLPDPHAAIRGFYGLLKPGGELVMSLPNTGGLTARIFRKNWIGYEAPRHLVSYNPKNLSLVLEKSGFVVERVITNSALGGIVDSIELIMGKKRSSLVFLHKAARAMKFLLDPFADFFKIGDQIVIRARKPKGGEMS